VDIVTQVEKTLVATPTKPPERHGWRRAAAVGKSAVDWLFGENLLQSFCLGLLCVVLIECTLRCAIDRNMLGGLAESGADSFMPYHLGEVPDPLDARPITVLDIDEQTWSAWGPHPYVPRDKLLELIRYAAAGRPEMIIVDVELLWQGEGSQKLLDYLRSYGKSMPPLILTEGPDVDAVPAPDGQSGLVASFQNVIKTDGDIAANPNIHWASPLFASGSDMMVRYWELWHPDCNAQPPRAVPSVQLLALALTSDHPQPAAKLTLDDTLTAMVGDGSRMGEACRGDPNGRKDKPIDLGNHRINLGAGYWLGGVPHELRERVLYTFTGQEMPGKMQIHRQGSEETVPLFIRLSAKPVSDSPTSTPPSSSPIKGRIVIIGGSFEEAHDEYPTPVGKMPGEIILANAINTMMQYGQLAEPGLWLDMVVGVSLGMVVWACLEFLHWALGLLVSAFLLFILISVIARFEMSAGVWFDMAVPGLAALLHRVIVVIVDCCKEGPGALLRRRYRSALAIGPLIMLVGVGAMPARADPVVAGLIDSVAPGVQASVKRVAGGQVDPAQTWLELYAGDIVHNVSASGDVKICEFATSCDPPKTVGPGEDFLVHPPPGPDGVFTAIANHVWRIARGYLASNEKLVSLMAVQARGLLSPVPALAIPLLQPGPNRVAGGTRDLALPWTGGRPPYAVQVSDTASHAALVSVSGLTTPHLAVPAVALAPGSYDIAVQDAGGETAIAQLTVVAPALLPDLPPGTSDLPPQMGTTIGAIWLAGQGYGFEAYLRASELASVYPPAAIVIKGLARGNLPQGE
jgi:CHASE2 domain-containing sensor protein